MRSRKSARGGGGPGRAGVGVGGTRCRGHSHRRAEGGGILCRTSNLNPRHTRAQWAAPGSSSTHPPPRLGCLGPGPAPPPPPAAPRWQTGRAAPCPGGAARCATAAAAAASGTAQGHVSIVPEESEEARNTLAAGAPSPHLPPTHAALPPPRLFPPTPLRQRRGHCKQGMQKGWCASVLPFHPSLLRPRPTRPRAHRPIRNCHPTFPPTPPFHSLNPPPTHPYPPELPGCVTEKDPPLCTLSQGSARHSCSWPHTTRSRNRARALSCSTFLELCGHPPGRGRGKQAETRVSARAQRRGSVCARLAGA